ncbi:hypothetical protein STXM2123_1599 [Streptomyces sp. F-3]|nr:hypothetical protein STXM2123_1599 [Streptomyces sp. F-3]
MRGTAPADGNGGRAGGVGLSGCAGRSGLSRRAGRAGRLLRFCCRGRLLACAPKPRLLHRCSHSCTRVPMGPGGARVGRRGQVRTPSPRAPAPLESRAGDPCRFPTLPVPVGVGPASSDRPPEGVNPGGELAGKFFLRRRRACAASRLDVCGRLWQYLPLHLPKSPSFSRKSDDRAVFPCPFPARLPLSQRR